MDNLKQSLLEKMADWLDDSETILEMSVIGLEDSEELHIKMCEAAFKVFQLETSINKDGRV